MVKIMETPIKMDDLGCKTPYFWKHPCHGVLNILHPPKFNISALKNRGWKMILSYWEGIWVFPKIGVPPNHPF